ncbi:prevent-host-death protein [Nocardioides sp. Soil805]|uniref:prevent-host-death protein n=1 Tax=Nocardioides sp. Soil805 TaxID=1736416 RepID=UPI0009E839BC|nr:prevent-host-death protein [Nocardioides sp. Soil805]
MATTHFPTMAEGRNHFKDVLDAAVEGRPASVSRDDTRVAAVDARRLVHFLSSLRPARAQLVAEDGGWSLFLPGLPIAASGESVEEALDEGVEALRDYAEAWSDRLRLAPNHEDNWGVVQLVELSSDGQLKAWLRGR